MKKAVILFLSLAALTTFLMFSTIGKQILHPIQHKLMSLYKGKKPKKDPEHLLYPNDAFWEQRAFPNAVPDEAAYFAAIQEARAQYMQRDGALFQGFDQAWTVEGPNNIGGRVNSIAVHPTNENIIYAGYERGGVWKTTNGGTNWVPILDNEATLSGGDICIDPSAPNTVYVGTGDPCIPFTTFSGNGIYKTTNGGTSWTNIGLQDCGVISRVEVAPNNSNIIYAASMGKPFVRNNNRGLFKSINGGLSWSQVLFINDETGVIDMVVNPTNPQEIYVAAMTCIRTYTENKRFSEECKILKTTNGGSTWTTVQGGLPVGEKHSRIGLAICKSAPNNVYAMYCDTTFTLENVYRTTNSGANWTTLPIDNGVDANMTGGFGWYFGQIRVHPNNPEEISLLGVDMYSTVDGGQSWFLSVPEWWTYEVHADKHDFVYTNTGKILLGTDGGMYRKNNIEATTWQDIEDIPCTQFYHVEYDPNRPTIYTGGAQDNGTTSGNATTVNAWVRDYGGDGFQSRFHPTDPNIYYHETQNGNVNCSIYGAIEWNGVDPNERRNWNTPYILSVHNPDVLYYGAQKLYKTEDGGQSLQPISEDLTGTISWLPSVHTITAITESPITQGKLYVGTGTGLVWRTDDDGGTWTAINQNGLPQRYLTSIEASPSNANRVFATFSGYKLNENTPHVYRSDNGGATWQSISSNLPNFVVNDIHIMPNTNDQILFIGTDAGVYGTLNGGVSWERLGTNMPFIPVNDVEYNPVLQTLIAGTYARSIWSYPMAAVLPTQSLAANSFAVEVLPNPASSWLRLLATEEQLRNALITVYDMDGKTVIENQSIGAGYIDISRLPAGTYSVRLTTQKGKTAVAKWMKI